jgi:hypothetical protein
MSKIQASVIARLFVQTLVVWHVHATFYEDFASDSLCMCRMTPCHYSSSVLAQFACIIVFLLARYNAKNGLNLIRLHPQQYRLF